MCGSCEAHGAPRGVGGERQNLTEGAQARFEGQHGPGHQAALSNVVKMEETPAETDRKARWQAGQEAAPLWRGWRWARAPRRGAQGTRASAVAGGRVISELRGVTLAEQPPRCTGNWWLRFGARGPRAELTAGGAYAAMCLQTVWGPRRQMKSRYERNHITCSHAAPRALSSASPASPGSCPQTHEQQNSINSAGLCTVGSILLPDAVSLDVSHLFPLPFCPCWETSPSPPSLGGSWNPDRGFLPRCARSHSESFLENSCSSLPGTPPPVPGQSPQLVL